MNTPIRAGATALLAVHPALARLRDHLRTDVLPAARTTPGVAAMPGGAADCEYQLEGHTTLRTACAHSTSRCSI